ncbi:MAG TPA: helix-turn-helix domain-containing protein [Turneriella sp.]|nr:helix-turn-helix domain-containing protein [Turneriella sp.]
MFRVSLITRNRTLVDFCKNNLPHGFTLKNSTRFSWGRDNLQGIILFDSDFLGEDQAAILPALAEHFNGKESAVSLCLMMNQETKARTLSLFPEKLEKIQGILSYRIENGKVAQLTSTEWQWFLETQQKILKQVSERILAQTENEILAARLSQISSQRNVEIRFPAFMHGKSLSIARFREKLVAVSTAEAYLFINSKGDIPIDDFLEYYASLIRPETPPRWRHIDFAKTPPHLHAQQLWPTKKSIKTAFSILCLQNLHLLEWQNQAVLSNQIRNLNDSSLRLIVVGNTELPQLVRRDLFRQDLYSLLRKTMIEIPPLYERIEDISHIAAEYIQRKNFTHLSEDKVAVAKKILNRFDVSTGYKGLFMTLDLMNELKKSKGMPVFELMQETSVNEEFKAAQAFLREEVEADPASLFDNLASGEKNSMSLENVEKHYITAVCQRYGWQVTEAARHLQISRKTLYDKMRRYKISRPDKKKRAS